MALALQDLCNYLSVLGFADESDPTPPLEKIASQLAISILECQKANINLLDSISALAFSKPTTRIRIVLKIRSTKHFPIQPTSHHFSPTL
ncbi:MAG: hypothetical protein JRI73_13785 [Deltaproteobacteria bacterium]|nr:hypothetical protein [Deltaproteobacteria bacterium]